MANSGSFTNDYERSGQKRSNRSWSLRLFLLSINFFLLFLIIDTPALQDISLVLMIGSILIVISSPLRGAKKQKQSDNVRDLFPLIGKYIKINRKFMLASIMGLLLAIVVISQIVILSNSVSGGGYDDVLSQGSLPMTTVRNFSPFGADPYTNTLSNISDQLNDEYQRLVTGEGFSYIRGTTHYEYSFFVSANRTLENDDPGAPTSFTSNIFFQNQIITPEIFNLARGFPSFPDDLVYSENMSLLVVESYFYEEFPEFFENLEEDQSFEAFTFSTLSGFEINLDSIWIVEDLDYQYAEANSLYPVLNSLNNKLVLFPGEEYETIGQYAETYQTEVFKAFVDVDSLKELEVDALLQSISSINKRFQSYLLNHDGVQDFDIYSEMEWELQYYQDTGDSISFVLLILSVPMLGVALYLVYFSLNLVEIRKQKLVGIMKIRGISSNQLRFMMTAEALIAASIATAIGMAISIPWTQYIFTQANLFTISNVIQIPSDWIWRLPIIGFILSINLNIGSILSISSTTVEDGENPLETKEPFWKRLYLDIIFTVLGTAYWIAIRVQSFAAAEIYFFLVFTLGPLTLLMLIIGLPLFVSRYYSGFLTLISDFFWKREGNLIALATRNMRKNKFSASKLTVLLMIGMMFSFVAIGVPHSFSNWNLEQAQFQNGADLAINNVDYTNVTYFDPLDHPDILATSQVKFFNLRSNSNQFSQIKIIGIDPDTYEDAAFWDSGYSSNSLDQMMTALEEGKILVQSDALNILNINVGDGFIVELPTSTMNEEIGGDFKLWPMMGEQLWYSDYFIESIVIVIPMELFDANISVETSRIIANVKDNMNHSQFMEDLQQEYTDLGISGSGFSVIDAYYQAELSADRSQNSLLFVMFDTLLIITIAASAIGVGYFSFITLAERKREMGVFRAVGMVSSQIFLLLIVEAFIMVITAILLGILFGIFISSNFFILIGTDFGQLPPIKLSYPPVLTLLFVGGMLVLTTIAAAVPARATARAQTGSILRAD